MTDALTIARAQRHLRFGWWALFVFASLGLMLEALHGFKVGYYLDVPNETRRLMWRLAHAHGVLLGLLNVGFGATVRLIEIAERNARWGSRGLLAATVLMPIGFFTGGIGATGGDPGLAIALVPVGGAALVLSMLLIATGTGKRP